MIILVLCISLGLFDQVHAFAELRNKPSNTYTLSNTGCACWFDLEGDLVPQNSCACCKPGGMQCGYPVHEYCHKLRGSDRRTGCKGTYLSMLKVLLIHERNCDYRHL